MNANTEESQQQMGLLGRKGALAALAAVGLAIAGLAALIVPDSLLNGLTFHNYIGRVASIATMAVLALYAWRQSVPPAGLLTISAIALVLYAGGSLVLSDGMLQEVAGAIHEFAGMAGDIAEVTLAVFFLALLAQCPVRLSGLGIPLALAGSHLLFLLTSLMPPAWLGIIRLISLVVGLAMAVVVARRMSATPQAEATKTAGEDALSAPDALSLRDLLPLLTGTALFPLLFVFIAHMSDMAEMHASMFAPSVEVTTIVALVVLALSTRFMKQGVSMGMTFLIPMPFFVTAMTLLPLFWGTELFVFGIAIKCGYLLYNALLWMMVAKLCEGRWRRALCLSALVTASTELFALLGRNAAAGMLGFGLSERDAVVYVALAAVWLLSMALIAFFVLDRRRETAAAGGADSEAPSVPTAVGASTAVADEAESDPFRRKCTCCAERFGLSERESEIMAEFARGRSADYLAKQLFISKETVKTHLKRIYAKCDVHSRQELLDVIESCEE